MNVTKVDFSLGGDGITGLYVDGKLIAEGDNYHDKIDDFIEGFLFTLNFLKVKHNFVDMIAIKENKTALAVYEKGLPAPKELQDFNKPF